MSLSFCLSLCLFLALCRLIERLIDGFVHYVENFPGFGSVHRQDITAYRLLNYFDYIQLMLIFASKFRDFLSLSGSHKGNPHTDDKMISRCSFWSYFQSIYYIIFGDKPSIVRLCMYVPWEYASQLRSTYWIYHNEFIIMWGKTCLSYWPIPYYDTNVQLINFVFFTNMFSSYLQNL